MDLIETFRLLWRLILYLVYGVFAFFFFQLVFSLSQPISSYIALIIPAVALLKDAYDFFLGGGYLQSVSYKFVEHNPFNIVLIWGVFTNHYQVIERLYLPVMVLSGIDLVWDGYLDLRHRPDTGVIAGQLIVVGLLILILHTTVGFEALQGLVHSIPSYLSSPESVISGLKGLYPLP